MSTMRIPHSAMQGLLRPVRPEDVKLSADEERALLLQLDDCRKALDAMGEVGENRGELSVGMNSAKQAEIRSRYLDIRARLALGSFDLVTHAARRYRNRGIPYADIFQEGFCGLLEAIDRFDISSPNRLAAYAVWWVRQRMQAAVAAGAYPVRLNPRCLRALAADRRRGESGPEGQASVADHAGQSEEAMSAENLVRLREVTRPTVWLDEVGEEADPGRAIADPRGDATGLIDDREGVETMLRGLTPREREVIRLRYGLDGLDRHSLGEASEVLGLSKERIRQIQEKALQKLRATIA